MVASGTRARLTSLTTPPKSIFPVRSHSALSCISITLPGIARHILALHNGIRCRHNLPERDAAGAWRDAFVPEGRESFGAQTQDRSFEQAPIEKAAAGQDDALFADAPAHPDDGLDHARMKSGRHQANGKPR